MSPQKRQTPGKPEPTVERIFYRPWEAAEALGISATKLYNLIKSGEVPSVRLGGSYRVPVEALKELAKKALAKAKRRESP